MGFARVYNPIITYPPPGATTMTYHTVTVIKSQTNTHKVSIAYTSEFGEYRCRITLSGKVCPDADYFTDNKPDALRTAQVMLDHADRHTLV